MQMLQCTCTHRAFCRAAWHRNYATSLLHRHCSRQCQLALPPGRQAHCRPLPPQAAAAEPSGSDPQRAVAGDLVTLHWRCVNEDGEVLQSSRASNDPATFEVGTGDIVGNPVFEAFDEAVRGLAVGEVATIKAQGGPWERDLMFIVPREHPEIARLEGRYKNQGGVHEGLLVELSNGRMAVVVRCDGTNVVLDTNNMLAGKTLTFEIELEGLERGDL